MEDFHNIIRELQDVLNISYQEATQLIKEYQDYGDVQLDKYMYELPIVKDVKERISLLIKNTNKVEPIQYINEHIEYHIKSDTKIDLLTPKPQTVDLRLSKSDNSISMLNPRNEVLMLDFNFPKLNSPSYIEMDKLKPLSISTIPSIAYDLAEVNRLNELYISNLSNPKTNELERLEHLKINLLRYPIEINIEKLSTSSSINKLRPSQSIDTDKLDVLSINKINRFKLGQVNARASQNNLPTLKLRTLRKQSYQSNVGKLSQLALYDLPKLKPRNWVKYKPIEFNRLHLEDNLEVLGEILNREILPPITKQDFIRAGADPDTVDLCFDEYKATSESYNLYTMQNFFKHAITEKDNAIAAGGNFKGLYKIVTQERGSFLPFITQFYMTDLCQYDENVGVVITRYNSMINSFLVNEANRYNMLIDY